MNSDDESTLAKMPAAELADVLDLILWDMSNPPSQTGGQKWLAELLARPDVETPEVQAAVAVMLDYLTPEKDRTARGSETFSRYDSADYLKDEDNIAAYLAAVMEEGDPALIPVALGNVARARMLTRLANDAGIDRRELVETFSGQRKPSLGALTKIAGAMGLHIMPKA